MSDELTTNAPPPVENAPRPETAGPGLGAATAIILLTTAPLIGVMYLAAQWLHLPFPPFDLYDWPIRAGFGPWIALINTLTGAQVTAGGNVAQSAPLIQWVLALSLFFLIALVFGLAFYLFVLRRGRKPDLIDGLTIGILFGAPMIFVTLAATASPLPGWLSGLWLAGLFILWGVVLSYAFGRLWETSRPASPVTDSPAAGGIGRRQFLIQFGAGATAVTALSAAAGTAFAPGRSAGRLQSTLPMVSPEFLEAQRELFGNFRRFAIVRLSGETTAESNVVALGAEYPDRNYVSIWLGDSSPIVIYENLATALAAYGTETGAADIYWLDN
jgi:hypothetical protein